MTSLLYDANDRLISEYKDDLTAADEDTFTAYEFTGTEQTRKTVYRGDIIEPSDIESDTEYEFNLQGNLGRVTAKEYGDTGILVAQSTTEFDYDANGVRVSEKNLESGDVRARAMQKDCQRKKTGD